MSSCVFQGAVRYRVHGSCFFIAIASFSIKCCEAPTVIGEKSHAARFTKISFAFVCSCLFVTIGCCDFLFYYLNIFYILKTYCLFFCWSIMCHFNWSVNSTCVHKRHIIWMCKYITFARYFCDIPLHGCIWKTTSWQHQNLLWRVFSPKFRSLYFSITSFVLTFSRFCAILGVIDIQLETVRSRLNSCNGAILFLSLFSFILVSIACVTHREGKQPAHLIRGQEKNKKSATKSKTSYWGPGSLSKGETAHRFVMQLL